MRCMFHSGTVKPKAKAKRRSSKNFEAQKPSDVLKADWIDAHGISVGHLPIFMQVVPKAETTSSEKGKTSTSTRKSKTSSASKPAPSVAGPSSTTRSSGSSALPHFEVPTEAGYSIGIV